MILFLDPDDEYETPNSSDGKAEFVERGMEVFGSERLTGALLVHFPTYQTILRYGGGDPSFHGVGLLNPFPGLKVVIRIDPKFSKRSRLFHPIPAAVSRNADGDFNVARFLSVGVEFVPQVATVISASHVLFEYGQLTGAACSAVLP